METEPAESTRNTLEVVPETTAPMLSEEEVAAYHVPQPAPPGWEYEEDAVYGTAGDGGRPLTAQVYRPTHVDQPRPAVVFVHGGAWAGGHPNMHVRLGHLLAERGYVSVCITYRLSPEAPWPAAIEDAKCAVRWVRAEHQRLGVDPERIAVMGGSAGGHLAALVALTPGRFEGTGGHPDQLSDVQAAVLLYPAIDMRLPGLEAESFEILKAHVDLFLGATDPVDASPITYVSPACPPVLTLLGDVDQAVPLPPVQAFHGQLDDAGVRNHLVVYRGRNHAFDFQPGDWWDVAERVSAFLDDTLAR